MKNSLKNFYDNLYKDKTKEGYKQEYTLRSKDFLHKYILFSWTLPKIHAMK